ncbi:hypothetical protein FRB90_008919 [Tulasnella sp. 427]|nr:hypothetical protein FRB90_008919 [Tulasnella sp. 427]
MPRRLSCGSLIDTTKTTTWYKALSKDGRAKAVCVPCMEYYRIKKGQQPAQPVIQPSNVLPFTTVNNANVPAIRKQTAAAQRNPSGSTQVARVGGRTGYTPVHQNYEAIAAGAKAQAYRSHRDTISFTTSLSFLTKKKVKSEVIESIYKQITVPVDASPSEIKRTCYDKLQDRIEEWAGIHAPSITDVQLVRGHAEFLEEDAVAGTSVILYDSYANPTAKGPNKVINGRSVGTLKKVLNKADSPFLALTEDQYEAIKEKLQDDAVAVAGEEHSDFRDSPANHRSGKQGKDFDSETRGSSGIAARLRKRTRQDTELGGSHSARAPLPSLQLPTRSQPKMTPPVNQGKAVEEIEISDSDLPDLPPPKKARTAGKNVPLFLSTNDSWGQATRSSARVSPPPDDLAETEAVDYQEVLKMLGQSSKARNDADFAYLSFKKLIEQGGEGNTVFDEDTMVPGRLEILGRLGCGSFKIANRGRVSHQTKLLPGSHSILSYPEVVAKEPYLRQPNGKKQVLPPNISLDHLTIAARELQCANALMQIAYDRIKLAIGEKALAELPPARFVSAGLAVHSETRRGYLLEEYIDPRTRGPFVKYISNASSKPLHAVLEGDYNELQRGLFLSAVQHAQYEVTGGLAFVSDLQGAGGLLSDPQILTSPQLGTLFGDGNVSRTWSNFKVDHQCTEYCKQFKLAPFPEASVTQPPTGKFKAA